MFVASCFADFLRCCADSLFHVFIKLQPTSCQMRKTARWLSKPVNELTKAVNKVGKIKQEQQTWKTCAKV